MKFILAITLVFAPFLWGTGTVLQAAEPAPHKLPQPVDHDALPPFIVENAPPPNVLIILDNSNSMDENIRGEPVGSFSDESRSETARRAIRNIIADHGDTLRIGLMTFRQGEDIRVSQLHAMYLYTSYRRDTYDPNGVETPFDAAGNARRLHNSSYADEEAPHGEDDHYLYFDKVIARQWPDRSADLFCYSTRFVPQPNAPQPGTVATCADDWQNAHLCRDNPYSCHRGKTGLEDIVADGEYIEATDQAALNEHEGDASAVSFALTGTDAANGVYQLGAQVAIRHVGAAWLSTSSPGGGDLLVSAADPGPAHKSELLPRVARVERFAEPYSMTQTDPRLPARNAGLTPLYSTLLSAQDYFAGRLDRFDPERRYASPITGSCQKNFIVLVTGGLPTENPYGDGDTIGPVVKAIEALRSTQATVDGVRQVFDIRTFILGLALPGSAAGALGSAAVAGGAAVNGSAYYVGDEGQLTAALDRLFRQISTPTASAPSVSVVSSARTGEGGAYQAVFHPVMTDGLREVHWAGDVRGLFLDAEGYLHESAAANGGPSSPVSAGGGGSYVTFCYDDAEKVVRVHKAGSRSSLPTESQILLCDPSVFTGQLADIEWLWSGGGWLAELRDPLNQRIYNEADSKRYLITAIDGVNGDGIAGSEEERPFLPASFSGDSAGLLQAGDLAAAGAIVNYVRGADQAGMRPRQIDHDRDGAVETWRLGDIINGGPVVVQRPAENLDLLYGDDSYREFAKMYRHRRQMVYAGANDGMLHAFNGGWYDAGRRAFLNGREDTTQHDLGAELWAYVPYNLLPHLRYITDPAYSSRDGRHLYFVDLQPVVFDAKIFSAGGITGQAGVDHTGGWGTLLVGGMRFGGREVTVEADPARPGSDVRTMRSAFFIIDITDPERPPKLLLEFTHPTLGYTTARPTPLKVGNEWYLMIGSGPYPADGSTLAGAGSTQAGRLFLIDLKRMALESGFGTHGVLPLSTSKSFTSDLVSVDFDIGDGAYATDAVYFGTVSEASGMGWTGDLQRVRIRESQRPWSFYPVDQWGANVLLETGKPMAAAPSLGLDTTGNRWIFAGSGRYFTHMDNNDSSPQIFYGVKEPYTMDAEGNKSFSWGKVGLRGLEDVSPVEIYADDDESRKEFDALRLRIAEGTAGWFLELPGRKERTMSQATLLGDILSFNTYAPSSELCADDGHSFLYALYFATGSAYFEPVIGAAKDGEAGVGAETQRVLKKIPLGSGMTAATHFYTGRGDIARAFLQTTDGNVIVIEPSLGGMMKSGPLYWELWTPGP